MQLMKLFVEQRYKEIADWSNQVRLNADEIKEAVKYYGQKVVFPPLDFFNHVDFGEVIETEGEPKEWYVVFELWMKEGKSDLSVELSIIDSSEEYYGIEIDNIHVM